MFSQFEKAVSADRLIRSHYAGGRVSKTAHGLLGKHTDILMDTVRALASAFLKLERRWLRSEAIRCDEKESKYKEMEREIKKVKTRINDNALAVLIGDTRPSRSSMGAPASYAWSWELRRTGRGEELW